MLAGGDAGRGGGAHGGHDFVPGAGQGFAQGRVVLQGFGVDHHQVDDFAGDLAGVEHLGHAWGGFDLGQQRVPGGDGGDIVGGEGGDQVGVGGVHHFEVFLTQVGAVQAAGQQVVGYRQFHQVDVLALEVGEGFLLTLEHDAVVAVGEVTDDQRGAVDAAGGGDGQGVHVGHGAAVELASGVLVDRLDVVVELGDFDVDGVLLRPFVDDAFSLGVFPWHPAGVDGPADVEVGLRGGVGRNAQGGGQAAGDQRGEQELAHGETSSSMKYGQEQRGTASLGEVRYLPGFYPAV